MHGTHAASRTRRMRGTTQRIAQAAAGRRAQRVRCCSSACASAWPTIADPDELSKLAPIDVDRRARTAVAPRLQQGPLAHQRSRVRHGRDADRGRAATRRRCGCCATTTRACRTRCTCTAFISTCLNARRRRTWCARLPIDDRGRLPTDLGASDTVLVWPGESVRVAHRLCDAVRGTADLHAPLPQHGA